MVKEEEDKDISAFIARGLSSLLLELLKLKEQGNISLFLENG
jgi:hypothetical protein